MTDLRSDLPFTYRPIDLWPGVETVERQRADFSATWSTTYSLLMRELRMLEAKNIVCQCAIRERDIRVDGHLRADARPSHPGIILAFESKYGPLKYSCDTFTHFDDNVRAIALGLEALRRVERYGIAKRAEQYRGWQQIGSGRTTGEPMSKEEAWRVLCDLAESPDESAELRWSSRGDVERLYRMAAQRHHPDKGGERRSFEAAVDARAALVAE